MKKNVIKAKSFEFAVAVTNCCRELVERKEFVLSKQLLRSGTSIGANIREAGYANSRRDFAYRLSISLRECSETIFWLDLLKATNHLKGPMLDDLVLNANELMRILTSIIKSTRENLKNAPDKGAHNY
jgi:four helix bundle protein